MTILVTFLKGIAIGLANIIPGVSGGTMALVLGLYERLIQAIHNLGPQTVKALFGGKQAFLAELKRIDALFLATLGSGALLAVVATAKLLTYLLQEQHDPTYGFFFGLVLASVVVPYRMIKRKGAGVLVACVAAVALVVGLTLSMSGEEQLRSAQKKAALKAAAAVVTPGAEGEPSQAAVPAPVPTDTRTMLLFFLAGVIAISAMILPGISGSFMLLLMGVYFDVLACIIGRQWLLLGIFALGCLMGMLAIGRLLNFLLGRYHDLTMGFMLGLVLGSLYAIWPFKSFGLAGGKRVDMENIVPQALGANELATLAAALVGIAIVAVFIIVEKRQGREVTG